MVREPGHNHKGNGDSRSHSNTLDRGDIFQSGPSGRLGCNRNRRLQSALSWMVGDLVSWGWSVFAFYTRGSDGSCGRGGLFGPDPFQELAILIGQRGFGKGKGEIMDALALGDIEAFVVGDDLQLFFKGAGMDIGNVFVDGQVIHFGNPFCELIKNGRIGL